ncbi:MAG: hypothetical protein B6I37_09060, partial [Desulfobacteraceae bacterium 4572_35.2]
MSTAVGNEAGVLSIGSGAGPDHIVITATYVNRHQRSATIWDIEHRRANIDIMLSSPSFAALSKAGELVEQALYKTGGVVSVARTWDMDKTVYNLAIDSKRAALYGLNSGAITSQLQQQLRGSMVATLPAVNSIDYGVRLWLPQTQRDRIAQLSTTLITTASGDKIPLAAVAQISSGLEPSIINREGLNYTLNVYGSREKAAISHIMDNFDQVFDADTLPTSVTMEQVGDIKQFKNSAKRMASAIGFAVILIFFTLITFFDSIKIPVMIIFSIPLTIIGVAWTLLVMDYHVAMPAMMGFILLSGIIVNNAILLIHFAQEQIAAGLSPKNAMLESIRIRTRPVLMTAFAVAAGMLPVAMGSAIGLERLAPLGAVAIGGLLIGTLLTLIF